MKTNLSLNGLLFLASLALLSSLARANQSLTKIKAIEDFSIDSTLDAIRQNFGFFNFPIYDEGSPQLRRLCPTFMNMNQQEKEGFWMNFWRQLANFESSGKMVKARAIHAEACGYLQLHCEQKKREASVKPEFRDNCRGDVQSNTFTARINNLKCGMAMLQQQVDMTHELFPDKDKQSYVYWQPLRNPKQMYLKICQYGPCGNSEKFCGDLAVERAKELK